MMQNVDATSLVCQSIVVLLCLICYQHALNGEYVFDDTVAIVKNTGVTQRPTNLTAIFQNDFWGTLLSSKDSHKSYRPLTTLMFHFEYAYLGWRAKQMKVVNLMLHCLNTRMVWNFVKTLQIDDSSQTATLTAALFALHPIHVEAVSGIVGRAELIYCFIFLLSLQLVAKNNLFIDLLMVLLTGIGLLFKETAITIPLACVFVEYMKSCTYNLHWRRQCKHLFSKRNIIFAISSLVMIILRLWVQNFQGPQFKTMDNPISHNENALTRILSQNYLYVVNMWLLLCPQWLSFDWAIGCIELVTNIWDIRLQAVLSMYSFIVLMLLNDKHNYGNLLSLGLLVIPFLPASGIIKVGFVIAERILYVPSIGFCLLVAHSFVRLLKVTNKKWLALLMKLMLMVVFLCFLLKTRERAAEWLSEEKLFQSALKVCPKNAKVHYNIARLASDKMERDKAFLFYHKAIELYPEYEAALMNLGNLYRESGDLVNAEKYLKNALEVFPEFAAAWMNLGIVQAARKQHSEALKSYKTALKYRPNHAVCYYNLGNLYLEQKKFTKATQNWQKSISLNPLQPKAWINILQMMDNRGLFEDGIRLSEQALKYLPDEKNILFVRANLFGKLQHNVEAETLYKRAIELDSKNVLFYTNFAILYHRWGKLDKAIECYEKALSIDREKAGTAKTNLDKLRKRLEEDKKLNKFTAKRSVVIEKRF